MLSERAFGKHSTSPRVLSITQPTEIGTVYSLEELKALSELCKKENLLIHMDGSRLYNAAASMKVDLCDLIHAAHLDILSLGGTKNGLVGAEAVVIFNPLLTEGSDHVHKQTLQLFSKMRYLSAQYIPLLTNGLWLKLATQANEKAREIATLIQQTRGLSLTCPVETNQIFFTSPAAWVPLIQERVSCYLWDREKNEIRFITSWNTTQEDLVALKLVLTEVSKNPI